MRSSTRRSFLRWSAVASLAGVVPSSLTAAAARLGPEAIASDLGKTFLLAARNGEAAQLKAMLGDNPALISVRDPAGLSPFALAHLGGYDDAGIVLLQHGHEPDAHEAALAGDWDRFNRKIEARPETVDLNHPLGGTAMLAAALGGAGSSIWRVYAASGHPSIVPDNGSGLSPLQAALRFRDLPVAEMTAAALLSNDADPNPSILADDPPLSIAAERGSSIMVETLIRLGARVDARDRAGRTALDVAQGAGQAEIGAMLRGHARIPRAHSSSRTAYDIHGKPYRCPSDLDQLPLSERRAVVGASHGNLDAVRAAVTRDARFAHSVATTSEITVEACAHTGRLPLVDYLLENGAPYSLPTATVRGDRSAMIRLLDQDGKRIQERGAHAFALLWYPIIGKCDPGITELLLSRGAQVEDQHWLGTTALHWAAIRGPIEVVELLLENGADVNRVGRKFGAEGHTPLQLAISNENHAVAKFLRQHGATA